MPTDREHTEAVDMIGSGYGDGDGYGSGSGDGDGDGETADVVSV